MAKIKDVIETLSKMNPEIELKQNMEFILKFGWRYCNSTSTWARAEYVETSCHPTVYLKHKMKDLKKNTKMYKLLLEQYEECSKTEFIPFLTIQIKK